VKNRFQSSPFKCNLQHYSTARAAAAVAAAEHKSATDARTIAEGQRMRAELKAKYSQSVDPALQKILDQRRRLPAWAKTAELLQAVGPLYSLSNAVVDLTHIS
jgi:hypothetical protein